MANKLLFDIAQWGRTNNTSKLMQALTKNPFTNIVYLRLGMDK